jgi:hypothetical protein
MTRESGFTLLHHYSCIVKFPFFCSCFYQSIVILSLKIYISLSIFNLQMRSHNWFYIWDWNHNVLLTSHIVVTSDINNRMVQILEFLIEIGFFYPSQQILWTNCFFQFLAWNGGFFHPSRICTRNLLPYMTVYWPSERACEESFLNGFKHYISTHIHHLYTTHVYSITWLSNNLNMLRANRNFDIIQLMQTKLGTSIICVWDCKSANPCVQLIE